MPAASALDVRDNSEAALALARWALPAARANHGPAAGFDVVSYAVDDFTVDDVTPFAAVDADLRIHTHSIGASRHGA